MAEPSVNRMCRRYALIGPKGRLLSLAAGLLSLALLTVPDTEKADCGNIADRYGVAVGRVIDAVRAYEKCVSSSDKRDDCAAQMQALDAAHDAFSDTVADAKTCQ